MAKRRQGDALRADAQRNRQRVLAAAEKVFASKGLDVPIDEVARRARVGIGTVYRHFPTKEVLFAAIVREKIERLVAEVTALADAEDAHAALVSILERMVVEGARKKDFVQALSAAGVNLRSSMPELSARLRAALGALLARARATGAVRADIDVAELLALVAGVVTAAEQTGADPSKLLAIVIAGLRVPS